MTQQIVILIAPDGSAQLQTYGFAGGQCRRASQFLEDSLGLITREQPTREFYQTAIQPAVAQQTSQVPRSL
jgi:Protein of unknown function (DUF2997)